MQLDYVAGLKSDRAIRNALQDLPSGLNEVYDQILAQLSSKPGYDPHLIRTILLWVSSSYTLMSTNEIAEAASMQPDDTRLDFDNVATDPDDLVALCGSLLRMERSHADSEPPLVGLVHHSAEEYLFSEHIARGQLSYFGINYYESHLFLAKQCLRYLAFENFCFPGLPTKPWFLPDSDIRTLKEDHALLQYASLKWADHLRDSNVPQNIYQAEILPLLPWFLKPGVKNNNYQVWQSIFHANCKHDNDCAQHTPFYVAIVQGLVHVVMTLLLDHMPEINTLFRNGWTPLTAALAADRVNMAHLLLSAGADPNVPADEVAHNGLSPLHVAAENNLELAVEMLLRSGASVHSRTYSKTTPLYRAARGGSLKVLTLLYEHGSDINARTWDDWTPLIEAISCGRLEIVEKLLDWGADMSITTDEGHNAYDFADGDLLLCSLLHSHEQNRRLRQRLDECTMP